MVKLLTNAGRCAGKYLALAALTTTLVACGGSSGDSPTDSDGDGFPRGEGPDVDEDGILDVVDTDVDLDGDGIDDRIADQDLDGDLIPNRDDSDADGDGLLDASEEDRFVDLDGDGLDDETGLTEGQANFDVITPERPCGGETGTDAYSDTPNWDDNCLIRGSNVGGIFADSLYAAGVQRVVFCAGFGGTDGQSYSDFADGEYGPASRAATELFQASQPNPIAADALVGMGTWAKLQDSITRLSQGTVTDDAEGNATFTDVYGFDEGRCADIPLFYQNGTVVDNDVIEGGWRLVKNTTAGTTNNESIPFSIDPPFNRLD
ncbi:MAG: peptidoglycan-binding protein [Granulosicoccus sp.]